MKTPEEYTEKLDCVFYEDYADSTGVAYDKYEILEVIKQVQIDAYNQAIDDAAESAKTKTDVAIFQEGTYITDIIDIESILKLKK